MSQSREVPHLLWEITPEELSGIRYEFKPLEQRITDLSTFLKRGSVHNSFLFSAIPMADREIGTMYLVAIQLRRQMEDGKGFATEYWISDNQAVEALEDEYVTLDGSKNPMVTRVKMNLHAIQTNLTDYISLHLDNNIH